MGDLFVDHKVINSIIRIAFNVNMKIKIVHIYGYEIIYFLS